MPRGVTYAQSLGVRGDASVVTKRSGDMTFNTNAALSYEYGPIACDGSTWRHLHTGATY